MPSHKSGLTMKKVTVRRGGRTFQRTQAVRASNERARNSPTFRLEATNKRQGPTARTSGNRIYF